MIIVRALYQYAVFGNIQSKSSQEPVRELYIWCQGCSHGGHLEHLTQWFKQSNECPIGCGHKCYN